MSRTVPRRGKTDAAAVVCAGILAAAVVLAFRPLEGVVACPSVRWFGAVCPGCGLTRAFAAIARGDFRAAWELHPWAFPLFLFILAGALRPFAARSGRRCGVADTPSPRRTALRQWSAAAGLLAFAGWALARAFAA